MKKIFLLFAFSLALLSCTDEKLDLVPLASVNEQLVLKKPSDFENFIRGAYVYMYDRGGESGYGGEFIIDTEVMTDNLIFSPQGRQTNLDGYRWTLTPSNTTFDYLESAYRPAELATKLLLNLDNIPKTPFRDNIEGEARFIRALCHFDMVRSYSKIPTQSADALGSLGVYYLEAIEPNAKPIRPTVNETYSKILYDLILAKDLIGSTNTVASGRATKSAVYGLLSRVYLYLGDYPKVITYGNLAVSNAPSAVASGTNFVNLWNDVNSDGVLFKLVVNAIDGVTPGTGFLQGTPANRKSEFVLTKEFHNLFLATDIRKTAYTATSNFTGNPYNHVIKYDGRLTGASNVVDIKVIRLEEVYLNMAEAQYKINGGGLATLDLLRSKRYTSFAGGETGAALWSAIMLERRLELAFEMDRFFTLKRLALGLTRSATQGHFASGTGVPAPANTTAILATDFRWQLPIPQYYRELNPNYQQNPLY